MSLPSARSKKRSRADAKETHGTERLDTLSLLENLLFDCSDQTWLCRVSLGLSERQFPVVFKCEYRVAGDSESLLFKWTLLSDFESKPSQRELLYQTKSKYEPAYVRHSKLNIATQLNVDPAT